MKPDLNWLAQTHAACFSHSRPWSSEEFAKLLEHDGTLLAMDRQGFALARRVLDEAEILTIAVLPAARRRGVASGLLAELEGDLAQNGARYLYLEVAEDNAAALALYYSRGYRETGRRTGYYAAASGPATDALILSKNL